MGIGLSLEGHAARRAKKALLTRFALCGSWRAVARDLGTSAGYLVNVMRGRRPPSRRLLLALGVIKPVRDGSGVRVRLSRDDAFQVMRGVVPIELRARVAGMLAMKECNE